VTTSSLSALMSSLRRTLCITFFALSANLSVDIVSATNLLDGLTVATSNVLVPPPKESYSNLVSLDSLKGTCLGLLPPCFYESTEMTLPSTVSDRLIFFSSFTCYFSISSSMFIFSEPDKSQRLNFDLRTIPFSSGCTVCITTVCLWNVFFSPI